MLYDNFIQKAADLTISQADNNLYYLEPLWKNILKNNQMYVSDISDIKDNDWTEIYNVLRLEVEKRNTINSLSPAVIKWVFDIISSTVEPAILAEETDYIKQVVEFMKANHEK